MCRFSPILGMLIMLFLMSSLGAQEVPFTVAASILPLCDLIKQVGGGEWR